jgi:deazaflavin-dependent oxidoreductase (nitroreductase family)
MTNWDKATWDERNRQVIEVFRANAGQIEGRELMLLTTNGAKTGKPLTTPLMYLAEEGVVYVIASKGGSPSHPAWYHNLVAHPTVTVEVGAETYEATASVLTGEERNRVFEAQARRYPFFAEYEKTTPRQIPVVALSRDESPPRA